MRNSLYLECNDSNTGIGADTKNLGHCAYLLGTLPNRREKKGKKLPLDLQSREGECDRLHDKLGRWKACQYMLPDFFRKPVPLSFTTLQVRGNFSSYLLLRRLEKKSPSEH